MVSYHLDVHAKKTLPEMTPHSSHPSHLSMYAKLTHHSAAAAPLSAPVLTTTPSAGASSPTSATSAGPIDRAMHRTAEAGLHLSRGSAAGTSQARSGTIVSGLQLAIRMAMSLIARRGGITSVHEVFRDRDC